MAGPNQTPGPTAIRAPTPDLSNHQTVLTQLKETTETAQRLRGNPLQSYVTLGELINAGIIKFLGGVVSPGDKIAKGGSGPINVLDSITGDGSTGTPLKLVGDSAAPGASKYYGTNGSSSFGYFSLPSGLTSPLNTKGDIWGYSTTNVRIPIGTNGQVLTADSTQTPGLKWATSSSGGVTSITSSTLTVAGTSTVPTIDLSSTQVANIAAGGTALQTASVTNSIIGNGTSGSPLKLSGDTASPGNNYLYGTNGSGVKGWYINSGASALAYANTTVPAGNTVANTATETVYASSYTIPANSLVAGSVIRLTLYGVYSTALVAPSIRVKIKFGSTIMLDTGVISPLVAGDTNVGWSATATFIIDSIGASGAIESQGVMLFQTSTTASATTNVENTAAITVDTTTAQAITATIQWGTASASNTSTLREMVIELLPPAGSSGGGGGGPALPGTIPNIVYWFQADLVIGNFLPQMPNSGYLPGFFPSAASSSTGATGAAATLNSKNVVNFPGTTASEYNFLTTPLVTLNNSTVFIVFNPTVAAASVDFIAGGSGAYEWGINSTGKLELTKALIAVIGDSATTLTSGVWFQANCAYNDTTGAWAMRIARAADASGTNIKAITSGLTTLGYNPFSGGVFFLNGKLAELIVYNRVLTPTEITNVENYLFAKWGV